MSRCIHIGEKIRQRARELLEKGDIVAVIGFAKGTLPGSAMPYIATTVQNTANLIWNRFCKMNLANYLARFKGKKVAIVAKGCDSRSIGILVAEKQLPRDKVYILGVPCTGMISRKKLDENLGSLTKIKEIEYNGTDVIATNEAGETKTVNVEDVLSSACVICMHKNPPHYDELLDEPVSETIGSSEHFSILNEFYENPDVTRWQEFNEMLLKCIRCYACRQACPTCYCDECFVDSRFPQWIDKGLHPTDVLFWHIGRIYHQAGRCVECGNCSEVCPVGIEFGPILTHQAKKVLERYNYDAGIGVEEVPPLQNYKLTDPQEFIL